MDPVTWTLVKSIPQHFTLQHKKNYEIRASPDLFRSVSVLGWGSSLVRGGGGGGGGWECSLAVYFSKLII